MTPIQFEQQYHRLSVSYQDSRGFAHSTTVNVHIYRQTSAAAVLPEKDALVAAVDQELRRAGGLRLIDVERIHREMIARAFYGKGSPEDCAIALRHAVRYSRAQPERLQHYCDQVARIGLDCSGFVNNYFRDPNHQPGQKHHPIRPRHGAQRGRRDPCPRCAGVDQRSGAGAAPSPCPHRRRGDRTGQSRMRRGRRIGLKPGRSHALHVYLHACWAASVPRAAAQRNGPRVRRAGQLTTVVKCQRKPTAARTGDDSGAEGSRTLDLRIANATLSQLSYRPDGPRILDRVGIVV